MRRHWAWIGGFGAPLAASGAAPSFGMVSSLPKVSPATTAASASTAAGQAFAVEGGTTVDSTVPRVVGACTHEVGATTMPSCTAAPFVQTTVARDPSVCTPESAHPSSGFAFRSASKSFWAFSPLIASAQSPGGGGGLWASPAVCANPGRAVAERATSTRSGAREGAKRGGERYISRQHRLAGSRATTGSFGLLARAMRGDPAASPW